LQRKITACTHLWTKKEVEENCSQRMGRFLSAEFLRVSDFICMFIWDGFMLPVFEFHDILADKNTDPITPMPTQISRNGNSVGD
jgi:hypothetical protein